MRAQRAKRAPYELRAPLHVGVVPGQVVMGVDFSALGAVRALLPAAPAAPYVYLNYRVFTRTAPPDNLQLIRRCGGEVAAAAQL